VLVAAGAQGAEPIPRLGPEPGPPIAAGTEQSEATAPATAASPQTETSRPTAATPQQNGATTPTSASPADQPLTRAEVFAEFKRLFDAGDLGAAVEQARKVVAAAESATPQNPEELQVALMNLALTEQLAGNYLEAEAAYRRVIEAVEASGRLASPRLARAYAGLATTYNAAGRHDLAVTSFEHAIALNRRSEGLFNDAQLPLLEKYAQSLTELGRVEEAMSVRRYALRVVGRQHGEQSLRYAGELETLGRWYARVRAYDSARYTLRRAIEIVETVDGRASPALIGPLCAVGDTARRWLLDPDALQRSSPDEQRSQTFHDQATPSLPELSPASVAAEGQRALERAAAIVTQQPDPEPRKVAEVLTQLGDWYQSRQQHDRAMTTYRQAYAAASRAEVDGKPMQDVIYGQPVLLFYFAPDGWDRYRGRSPEERDLRQAELELTVTADGRTKARKVLDDSGDPRRGAQAERAAETAIYRPRWVAGEPVETAGIRFVQPFFVLREGVESAGKSRSRDAEAPGTESPGAAPSDGTTRDEGSTNDAAPPADPPQNPGSGASTNETIPPADPPQGSGG
jgi:tetratricopeptide (TPR) repeat protein